MQTTFRAIVEDTKLGHHRAHRDADEAASNFISKQIACSFLRFLCVSVPPWWIRFLLSAIIQAVIALRVLIFLTFAVAQALSQPAPQPALPAVLGLFDRYPLVILAEEHWKRALGDFYVSLVRHPDFPKQAGTLVLECGNSLYQPILDRYENGEDVPFEQISQVWRNTTKVLGWESPIYANLIAAVREVNRSLPPERKIRVIAADSPIDWSQVRDDGDYDKAFGGDKFFASVIEREVLAKNRKALVIMGINHVTRGGDRRGDPDVTTMIEKYAHHSTYVVLLGGINPNSDPSLRGAEPVFYPLRGTPLGQLMISSRRAEEAADAFLYLPHSGELVAPDWDSLPTDKSYFGEIQRRHLIEFGCPLNIEKWKRMQRPCS